MRWRSSVTPAWSSGAVLPMASVITRAGTAHKRPSAARCPVTLAGRVTCGSGTRRTAAGIGRASSAWPYSRMTRSFGSTPSATASLRIVDGYGRLDRSLSNFLIASTDRSALRANSDCDRNAAARSSRTLNFNSPVSPVILADRGIVRSRQVDSEPINGLQLVHTMNRITG